MTRFVPLDVRCRDCGQPPGQRCRGPDGAAEDHAHLKRKDDAALINLRRRRPPDAGTATALAFLAVAGLSSVAPRWYR